MVRSWRVSTTMSLSSPSGVAKTSTMRSPPSRGPPRSTRYSLTLAPRRRTSSMRPRMGEPNGTISVSFWRCMTRSDRSRKVSAAMLAWRIAPSAPTVRTGSGSALMMKSLVGAVMPPPASRRRARRAAAGWRSRPPARSWSRGSGDRSRRPLPRPRAPRRRRRRGACAHGAGRYPARRATGVPGNARSFGFLVVGGLAHASSVEGGGDLPDEPRPADCGPADHHGGGSGRRQAGGGVFDRGDVAIGDHRDPWPRHDLGDALPIGAALVELLAGAAMDRDRLDAERFAEAGKLGRVDAILIPAEPHLHRDRDGAGRDRREDKPSRQVEIAHQRRAGIAARDFFRRTAHVDVDDRRTVGFGDTRRLPDPVRIAAPELDDMRGNPLALRPQPRLGGAADVVIGGNHLGEDGCGPETPGD